VLVYEFIESCSTLANTWQEQPHRRNQLAVDFLRLFARMHRYGCRHSDPHMNNFLLTNNTIMPVDLESIYLKKDLRYCRWQRANIARVLVRVDEAQLAILNAALATAYPQAAADPKLAVLVECVRRRRKGRARTPRKYFHLIKQYFKQKLP
jgi:tRNA A-37 threonylcarbamoyl transferase component Bud32